MEAAAAATKNHKKFMNDFVLYEFITGLNNTKNKEEITSNPVVQNFPIIYISLRFNGKEFQFYTTYRFYLSKYALKWKRNVG